jgi:hypothetical protein
MTHKKTARKGGKKHNIQGKKKTIVQHARSRR